MITQARLQELLNYSPKTGLFHWNISTSNRRKVGTLAGTVNKYNHRYIAVDKQVITAHRLAWLYVYGDLLPITTTIHHINGDTLDNRIDNLELIPLLVHDFIPPNRSDSIEIWKPMLRHEDDYEVSNHGRIKCINHSFAQMLDRIIPQQTKRLNYQSISTSQVSQFVHILVAEAFLDKPTAKHVVNHKNHIPNDNHVNNLEFVTRSENIRHAVRNGRKPGPRTGKRT